LDSKRVLRGTLATMATAAALSATTDVTMSAPALAAAEDGTANVPAGAGVPVVHEGLWRAPVVRVRVWRTTAKPRVAAHRPLGRTKQIALDHVVRRSWSYREFRCLDSLWTRESGWNHRAYNSSSGAYGIPQALPAVKMSGAGSDWRSNPETQIKWGLGYIKGRYGRPCGAWGHFLSHNWY
jgi:hypothetical protein